MVARANRSLDRVGAAFLTQLVALAEPSRGLERRDLGRLMFLASDTLATIEQPNRGTPITLGDHLYRRELGLPEVREQIAGLIGSDEAATLSRQLEPMIADLVTALGEGDLPNTVASDFGVVRFIDYLRANTVFAVDLALDATGATRPPALAEAVRALAGVLVERYPGQTIEVRVPPYVAVQVSAFEDGPAHTRGTPPNVVETSPQVFIALATARLGWAEAAGQGTLLSSGVHAHEAGRMFPVINLR